MESSVLLSLNVSCYIIDLVLVSIFRYRRAIFIGIVGLIILLYLWPSWMSFRGTRIKVGKLEFLPTMC